MQAPVLSHDRFVLSYEGLVIGTLSVQDGLWRFQYSDQFKQTPGLRPLVEFPEVDQIYESKDLWQFFVSRIPSAEQPEVEQILKREKIREDDAVSLLKRFGTRTISSPFQLESAA